MTLSKLPPKQENSASLRESCAEYDAQIFPKLLALSMITSVVSAVGIAGQFQSPDFDDHVLAAAFGFALWLICSGFWYGAWLAPVMSYKNPTRLFAFMVVAGFCSYAGISVTANFTATAGKAAIELTQQRTIDGFDNAGAMRRPLLVTLDRRRRVPPTVQHKRLDCRVSKPMAADRQGGLGRVQFTTPTACRTEHTLKQQI